MLYHLSIAAAHPRNVAHVIAEIWGGVALPFPSVHEGSWIALADDDRGTAIEVYPDGVVLRETAGDADPWGEKLAPASGTATHCAIGTALDVDAVTAIAAREGWPLKYRRRGGVFGVLELWIEGRQMIEVLTQQMQDEYVSSVTVENWRAMLAAQPQIAA